MVKIHLKVTGRTRALAAAKNLRKAIVGLEKASQDFRRAEKEMLAALTSLEIEFSE